MNDKEFREYNRRFDRYEKIYRKAGEVFIPFAKSMIGGTLKYGPSEEKEQLQQSSVVRKVVVSLQIEGLHKRPNCNLEEVIFLRDLHRHMFHIRAEKTVSHNDRDIEIIMLRKKIYLYLYEGYYDRQYKTCVFGSMSCESIAAELMREFGLCSCEVLEDGENGALLST